MRTVAGYAIAKSSLNYIRPVIQKLHTELISSHIAYDFVQLLFPFEGSRHLTRQITKIVPACLSACMRGCLPVCVCACVHACIHACLPACLPACCNTPLALGPDFSCNKGNDIKFTRPSNLQDHRSD